MSNSPGVANCPGYEVIVACDYSFEIKTEWRFTSNALARQILLIKRLSGAQNIYSFLERTYTNVNVYKNSKRS